MQKTLEKHFSPKGIVIAKQGFFFFNGKADTSKVLNSSPGKKVLTKYILPLKEGCKNLPGKQNSFIFFKVFKACDPKESLIKLNEEKN